MEPMISKSVSVHCLDCDWTENDSRPNFRPKARNHVDRMDHRVKLVTVTTVIYSDRPIYESKTTKEAA